MSIPVTTRGGKGSALTQSEMDTNLTNLARDASTTQQGNIRATTNAEAQAGAATNLAVTPAALASVLNLADFSLSANGYIKLQNGVMIQWGSASVTGDTTTGITFPQTFPSAVFYFNYCIDAAGLFSTSSGGVSYSALTTSTVNIDNGQDISGTARWIAIGY
ncbi:hypothetical protein [Zhongshania sp.]|uniref:gp53-like domain-containing protein n=1 Tax=Zhongshania sp. TaxID=1971902 RepID=UPI003561CE37